MFEKLNIPKELRPNDIRFGVGPSLIPKKYVQNLADVSEQLLGTSHRQKAVRDLCRELQFGLHDYFNLPEGHKVIMGNGGATFLFDMIGLGLVHKKSLHYTMGEFSHKWFKAHAKIPWIEATEKTTEYGFGEQPQNDDHFDMICCTLNETSTGVMISELPDVGDETLLAVDATSGAGQIKVDFNKVDIYFFSPQKVFAGEGGFYICIMSPKAMKRAYELDSRKEYIPQIMSWKSAIDNSLKHQTFNTPSISTIFYLNEQIKEMNKLGEDAVIKMADEKAAFMYNWVDSKEYLSCFVIDPKYRSNAVITVDIDEKYNARELCLKLRELKLALDIEGYRKLGRNQLRISMFHNVQLSDLEKLTKIISIAIEGVNNE